MVMNLPTHGAGLFEGEKKKVEEIIGCATAGRPDRR